MSIQILHGDCRDTLKTIPDGTVQMCVTSPPYWGLRSYLSKGHADKTMEIGQEPTPDAYVQTMVEVFREVRRCLHDSGTVWLNVGDSYHGSWGNSGSRPELDGKTLNQRPKEADYIPRGGWDERRERPPSSYKIDGLKPKDLCLIPWRLAIALQADGWWVRSVICWAKKSCMPESVTDRPTNSWEPIFLLAKSQRYFYDAEAVKEKADTVEDRPFGIQRDTIYDYNSKEKELRPNKPRGKDHPLNSAAAGSKIAGHSGNRTANGELISNGMRNQRNVWTLGPEPYSEAHFATFPTEIPRRAILAGTSAKGCCQKCFAPWDREVDRVIATSKPCPKTTAAHHARGGTGEPVGTLGKSGGGRIDGYTKTLGWKQGCHCGWADTIPCTVLDPFGGSGTVGQVATELGRQAILCELNDAYLPLIDRRTNVTKGLALA